MTADEAFAIQEARGLTTERGPDGWLCRLGGNRVRVPAAPTPLAAIEAADRELTRREGLAVDRRAKKILEEQQRGEHFFRPREEQVRDPVTGEMVTRRVFDVLRVADSTVVVAGRESVTDAWTEAIATRTGSAVRTNGNGGATR